MLSLFYLSRIAIAHMRKQGKGVIVATASTAGLSGYAGLAPYATAKAGRKQIDGKEGNSNHVAATWSPTWTELTFCSLPALS